MCPTPPRPGTYTRSGQPDAWRSSSTKETERRRWDWMCLPYVIGTLLKYLSHKLVRNLATIIDILDIIFFKYLGFIDFIVNPLFEVFSDVINHVLDKDSESTSYPWNKEMNENKDFWQEKVKLSFSASFDEDTFQINKGEIEFEKSDSANDVQPPAVINKTDISENGVGGIGEVVTNGDATEDSNNEEPKFKADNLDNRHLIKQIGPIRITSKPPDKPTRHRDVIQHVSANILSRPGSPVTWDFGVKESITTAPPRPTSATMLSPPEKRRAPISVDHTLRKHALDFS